jgi:hypothetical protein
VSWEPQLIRGRYGIVNRDVWWGWKKKRILLELQPMVGLKKFIILGFVMLSISIDAMANEGATQKRENWDERLEMLRAVPYVGLSEISAEEGESGVIFYNQEKAYHGYNLYATRNTSEAFLLDMEGQIVHRWIYPPKKSGGSTPIVMLENGDLVVVKTSVGLLRVNWDSQAIWQEGLLAHHDVARAPDGSFYVIARDIKEHRNLMVNFPAIIHLTADGEEIDRWSAYDHLDELKSVLDTRSFLDTVLDSALGDLSEEGGESSELKKKIAYRRYHYNYFHMNGIDVLPVNLSGKGNSRFREGNLLVCIRNVNQIAVLEKDTHRILWAWGEGELEWPHHPTMLENGHILVFDNGVKRGFSRVLELDPVAGDIVWQYTADPPEDFHSYYRGSAQRLPNGNTLICESDKGRVFEVTEQGEVVWTWLNPITRRGHREVLYRMLRWPADHVDRLLNK